MPQQPTPRQVIASIAAQVYPTDVFPEPVDLGAVHEHLKAGGWNLDQITAHVSRRMLYRVASMAQTALSDAGYSIVRTADTEDTP